jgi:hypothetical protein
MTDQLDGERVCFLSNLSHVCYYILASTFSLEETRTVHHMSRNENPRKSTYVVVHEQVNSLFFEDPSFLGEDTALFGR